jgi:pilus assembly protein CpaD
MIMARFKSSAALAAMAIAATGCAPQIDRLTPVSNTSMYSVNQPVVQRTDYVLDLNSGGGGVEQTERRRLADWFESLRLRYGDRVSVDEAPGYVDATTRHDIAEVAAEYGLLLDAGAPVTAGGIQPGSVRVIVSRTSASVPGCPNWADPTIGAPERLSANYGCATNSNLAAMIADPNDLVLGQTGSNVGNSTVSNKAINAYRTATPTGAGGLKSEKTGGK